MKRSRYGNDNVRFERRLEGVATVFVVGRDQEQGEQPVRESHQGLYRLLEAGL